MALLHWSGTVVNRTVEYRSSRQTGCEDMPRKFIDIKFSDYPVQQKRGNCALFLPSGEDRSGQRPEMGQGTGPLRVLRAAPCAPGGFCQNELSSYFDF